MNTVFVSGEIIDTEEEVVIHKLVVPENTARELFDQPERFIIPVGTETRFNGENGTLEVRVADVKEGDLKFPDPRGPFIWASYGTDGLDHWYLKLMWTSLASDNPNTTDIERLMSRWPNLSWLYRTHTGEYQELLNGTMPEEEVARVDKIDFDDFSDDKIFVITTDGVIQHY